MNDNRNRTHERDGLRQPYQDYFNDTCIQPWKASSSLGKKRQPVIRKQQHFSQLQRKLQRQKSLILVDKIQNKLIKRKASRWTTQLPPIQKVDIIMSLPVASRLSSKIISLNKFRNQFSEKSRHLDLCQKQQLNLIKNKMQMIKTKQTKLKRFPQQRRLHTLEI